MQIRVAIVDDKTSNRNIIQDKLRRSDHFIISFMAANGREFLDILKTTPVHKLPEVVLMDIEMPIMDGVETIASASTLFPKIKFVVLTIFDDEDKIFHAIKAGAYGYLLKENSSEKISEILLQMHETGIAPISPGIAHKILQLVQENDLLLVNRSEKKQENLFNLTEREKQILELLKDGLQYKEIGAKLGISANTAKKHVVNIYEKLHVNCRAQALNLAYSKNFFAKPK